MKEGRSPQVSATIPQELNDEIVDMAEKNDQTVSKMVAILLAQAVKERKRKRNGKAKNNTGYNPSNMGQGDR
jgi:CRISPR/Cas system-associated endonuclease/helicase Cas3